MKLLDLVMKDIKDWPKGADYAGQSTEDSEIYFFAFGCQTPIWSHTSSEAVGGVVTKEEFEKLKYSDQLIYHCPTCDSGHSLESTARNCCDVRVSLWHSCSDCGSIFQDKEAADICCRSTSKKTEVDVKTVLYAAFDLLSSHREISDNEYTIVGSNSLDDIGGLLQDYIEQNAITGF